ncbi:hypothetical protein BofuT4_P072260.1 [Botrytis cinerea T4]|uniref:Uncharacterized protein n=1 Tax=Botryotinia fuckeliana (strain T4) TaxID=999810 RepID=G2XPK3_BOTF4|nr:hypothetical protein BofuT4_P072260.1 [Botrytis cinerea T4]
MVDLEISQSRMQRTCRRCAGVKLNRRYRSSTSIVAFDRELNGRGYEFR